MSFVIYLFFSIKQAREAVKNTELVNIMNQFLNIIDKSTAFSDFYFC